MKKKAFMKNIFEQLDKQEEIKSKIFNLWLEGKTLSIPSRFFDVAKVIGQEFFDKYKKTARIKVIETRSKKIHEPMFNMKKEELRKKIKSLLMGAITTQNTINKGMLNQKGIDYICEKLTDRILELFSKVKK